MKPISCGFSLILDMITYVLIFKLRQQNYILQYLHISCQILQSLEFYIVFLSKVFCTTPFSRWDFYNSDSKKRQICFNCRNSSYIVFIYLICITINFWTWELYKLLKAKLLVLLKYKDVKNCFLGHYFNNYYWTYSFREIYDRGINFCVMCFIF